MASIFRLYARTSQGNQRYLQEQLHRFGLVPKYQSQFNGFYFSANFQNLIQLSFKSMTIQSLYIQLGQKFNAATENNIKQALQRIQFNNYIPLHPNLISDTTLNIQIRQSTQIPSEKALISIINTHLQKLTVMKQYKKNIAPHLSLPPQNYHQIKSIVDRKWILQEEKRNQLLLTQSTKSTTLLSSSYDQLGSSILPKQQQISQHPNAYNVSLMFYIRKNLGRILLKVNKQHMYKHGWKKAISWGAMRQSIVASVLYRSGILQDAIQKGTLSIWDPFCGSGTIPLVACCLCAGVSVRQDYLANFTWPHWGVFKQQYLNSYLEKQLGPSAMTYKVLGSDISLNALNIAISNFKNLLPHLDIRNKQTKEWLIEKPTQQIYEIVPKQIYFACGNFSNILKQMLKKQSGINIVSNLPYLYENSADHQPINQVVSAYCKFDKMLSQNSDLISNAFILIAIDTIHDSKHFFKVSKQKWILLEEFDNGGIKIGLYGWSKNRLSLKGSLILHQNQSVELEKPPLPSHLVQYRSKVREISQQSYPLPEHLIPKPRRGQAKSITKARVRNLKLDYVKFSRHKDLNQAFMKYASQKRKKRMMKRGQIWKAKNIALMKLNISKYSDSIKSQFQKRIDQAAQWAQKMKKKEKPNRKW